jgi:hypothetical protein
MAPLTPDQRRRRNRIELVIRLAAPGLNLVLAAGERLSRIVDPGDGERPAPRAADDGRPTAGDRRGTARP